MANSYIVKPPGPHKPERSQGMVFNDASLGSTPTFLTSILHNYSQKREIVAQLILDRGVDKLSELFRSGELIEDTGCTARLGLSSIIEDKCFHCQSLEPLTDQYSKKVLTEENLGYNTVIEDKGFVSTEITPLLLDNGSIIVIVCSPFVSKVLITFFLMTYLSHPKHIKQILFPIVCSGKGSYLIPDEYVDFSKLSEISSIVRSETPTATTFRAVEMIKTSVIFELLKQLVVMCYDLRKFRTLFLRPPSLYIINKGVDYTDNDTGLHVKCPVTLVVGVDQLTSITLLGDGSKTLQIKSNVQPPVRLSINEKGFRVIYNNEYLYESEEGVYRYQVSDHSMFGNIPSSYNLYMILLSMIGNVSFYESFIRTDISKKSVSILFKEGVLPLLRVSEDPLRLLGMYDLSMSATSDLLQILRSN